MLPNGQSLPPSGCLYPLHATEDVPAVSLTWQNGFLAALFIKLIAQGVEVEGMNSRRLQEEIWRLSEGDPWRLDMSCMAQALATGEFSVYSIRKLPADNVLVSPGTGRWFLESPFSVPGESDSAGKLTLPDLPLGLHTLFALDGDSWYLLSFTEDTGVLLLPGGS
jgi:hypothetical protein